MCRVEKIKGLPDYPVIVLLCVELLNTRCLGGLNHAPPREYNFPIMGNIISPRKSRVFRILQIAIVLSAISCYFKGQ